jgi:uncharacterized protein
MIHIPGSEIKINRFFLAEIIAILASGILKFTIMDWLGMRAFFILGICLIWTVYILFRHKYDKDILKEWGFTGEHFLPSMLRLLPVLLISVAVSVIYGEIVNGITFSWQIIPIFFLYPIWGVFQQYLMLGLVAENLTNHKRVNLNKFSLMLVTSALFSMIHFPDYFLMIYVFGLETVFFIIWSKWKNLWAIGLVHGWIGTFLLFFVSGRDLWSELFAWFK